MGFVRSLFASDDKAADSIVFCGVIAMVALVGLSAYDVVVAHHDFGALNFAAACTTVLGGIGGSKRVRDSGPQVQGQ